MKIAPLLLLVLCAAACGAPSTPDAHDARDAEAFTVAAVAVNAASDVESEFRAFAALVDEPQECIALTFCDDGCVDIKDDVDNCGGCGMRCLLGDYCQDGQCHCTSDEGPE